MTAEIRASRHDATLILTLSNPGARNALHPDMFAVAIEVLSTAERDDTIRAVVMTGADHCFCSGGNLHYLLEQRRLDVGQQAESIDLLRGWIEAIQDCPKPVIAAVEGTAAGAGFSLALACDLIVASNTAKFAMSYARVGLTPDGGGSWFLSQSLPRQLATELMLEGKAIDAQRLYTLGLVNRVVQDGSALESALDWANELAALSGPTVDRIKQLAREANDNSLARHFEVERRHLIESLNHPHAEEGISAFLDKRTPHYK